MGRISAGAVDQALAVVAASFTATGATGAVLARGGINVTVAGTFVATVQLERSFDGGGTWHVTGGGDAFLPIVLSSPASFTVWEPEAGMLYRLNCTAFTSGTVACRLSA